MKERMENVREQVKEARAVRADIKPMRAELRGKMRDHRLELDKIRSDLAGCKAKRDADCEQKRKDAKLGSKDILLKAAEDVLAMLDAAKARIAESALDVKDAATAKIDEQIAAIGEAKTKVEALTETSTKEEIKDAAKNLRKVLQDAKHALRFGAHKVIFHRLGGVIAAADKLEDRIENALKKLEAKGVDVSSVDIAAFEAKLDEAEKFHSEAKKSFEAAMTAASGEKDELMKKAHESLRKAHAAIKEAHKLLRDLLHNLKALKGGSEELASAPAEDDDADDSAEDDADEADTDSTSTSTETTPAAEATAAP
jgi:hypothetical protein